MLKDTWIFTYYNVRPTKLAPNSPQNAKKCDLVDFSSEIVSIKASKDLEYNYNQIPQSNLAFFTILCYANNKQTVSHHRRIQHEDNRATAHRTQK